MWKLRLSGEKSHVILRGWAGFSSVLMGVERRRMSGGVFDCLGLTKVRAGFSVL